MNWLASLTDLFNSSKIEYRTFGTDRFQWGHISCALSTWWRHQMETFSALLAICVGDSSVTGEFPTQRPVTQSFDVFFDLRLNKRLSKLSWAGDLRRHRAHYDVIVMSLIALRRITTKPLFAGHFQATKHKIFKEENAGNVECCVWY